MRRVGPVIRRLAIFSKNRSNPAYENFRIGADRAAARLGAETLHFVPDRDDDVDQQTELVLAQLERRPDGVVLAPVDDRRMAPAVARMTAAGIPTVLAINPMRGEFLTFVGGDDRRMGEAMARRLFEAMGGGGEVVMIEGRAAAPTSRARSRGFRAALADFAGVEVVGVLAGDYDRDQARTAMAALLAAGRSPAGVWAANDVMALGALEALDAAGRQALVVGANGVAEALAEIRRGRMLATADFDAFSIAAEAVRSLVHGLSGGSLPKRIHLPAPLIDASNAASFLRSPHTRDLPSW